MPQPVPSPNARLHRTRLCPRCRASTNRPTSLASHEADHQNNTAAPPQAAPAPAPATARPPVPFKYRSLREDLAIKLAYELDDFASLAFYSTLAKRWSDGTLMPGRKRLVVAGELMRKAEELGAQRHPQGPLRNPAAVFASWTKRLGSAKQR